MHIAGIIQTTIKRIMLSFIRIENVLITGLNGMDMDTMNITSIIQIISTKMVIEEMTEAGMTGIVADQVIMV